MPYVNEFALVSLVQVFDDLVFDDLGEHNKIIDSLFLEVLSGFLLVTHDDGCEGYSKERI